MYRLQQTLFTSAPLSACKLIALAWSHVQGPVDFEERGSCQKHLHFLESHGKAREGFRECDEKCC